MRKLIKYLSLILPLFVFFLFGIEANAAQTVYDYTVSQSGGEYRLYSPTASGTDPIYRAGTLNEIIKYTESADAALRLHFAAVESAEDVRLSSGTTVISGSLGFVGAASLKVQGADITLVGASLSFEDGALWVDSGRVLLSSGSVSAHGAAVVMDYSAGAYFEVSEGDIASSGESALVLKQGVACIKGGKIKASKGKAIENHSTLILCASPEISGKDFDVETSSVITLYDKEDEFSSNLRVRYYSEFKKGSSTEVFRAKSGASVDSIQLFDKNLSPLEITYFEEKKSACVHLPFTVSFYDCGMLYGRADYLLGEIADRPTSPTRTGYDFYAWRLLSDDGEIYEFAEGVNADISLYSSYKLTSPSFTLSSLAFEYDSVMRFLTVEELSHPFLDEGLLGFEWYKNGNPISRFGDRIGVKGVSDSGMYKCKITFSVAEDTVTVFTPEVSVRISHATVALPSIPSATYTGDEIYPEIYDTALYSAERYGAVNVGVYPIKLTLIDKENYRFAEGSEPFVFVNFCIEKAQNYWREPLSATDVYEGEPIRVSATPAFGEVKYYFSTVIDGRYSDTLPEGFGVRYVRAEVVGNANYTSVISEPCKFSVLEEVVLGVAVITPASKVSYRAFEEFDTDGLTLGVSYNSGRQITVGKDQIKVRYQRENSFRYRDTGVILCYEEASVLFRVEVRRAEYDIASLEFNDVDVIYDGTHKSASYSGRLPIGLDGKPLTVSVSGGGVNVGEYTCVLTFSTESENYRAPDPITAFLTVKARECEVIWGERVFVYDGAPKLPNAYFIDCFGSAVSLYVSGARVNSGLYKAYAVHEDPNYVLSGAVTDFTVAKASYDMSGIIWNAGEFVYDGSERRVEIVGGLPFGISVIGYADNRATDSGEYVATVTFGYDAENYNPPVYAGFSWKISKAVYPTDGFSFDDSATLYDGKTHYPTLVGSMPTGLDGSMPEYSFSSGARDVRDGRVRVEISFFTTSKNYVAPDSIYAYAEILPIPIEVVWGDFEFVYDGTAHLPRATSEACEIIVTGAETDAGDYTALAASLDLNYSVTNQSCAYKIHKAQNSFVKELEVSDVYFGRTPAPGAVALGGEVVYIYFTDEECTVTVEHADKVGRYYVKAYSPGSNNYEPIWSDALTFNVIAVIPIGISVELVNDSYCAFELVTAEDVCASVRYNDGAFSTLSFESLRIAYQTADSFRFGDTSVTVSWGEFFEECEVKVNKAKYDMSSVAWEGLECVYDKNAHSAVLSGLPEGVSVLEYISNSNINAGQYEISAVLSYDEENYEEPIAPMGVMVISRMEIPIPTIESAIYCGTPIFPSLPESELFSFSFAEGAVRSGMYAVELRVNDPVNTCFVGGEESANAEFWVLKRFIRVKVSDVSVYLFENYPDFTFELVGGTLVDGDVIAPSFYTEGDEIFASFNDPDYDVLVIPGKITRIESLSPEMTTLLLILFLSLFLFVLFFLSLMKIRRRLYISYRMAQSGYGFPYHFGAALLESPKLKDPSQRSVTLSSGTEGALETTAQEFASVRIDAEYADSAITNNLAKSLLRREGETVATYGWRRKIVNVDTLSEHFAFGESVDINSLKEKGIVPPDTAYVKILARGFIDKPLNVYANEFSLAAVKMIALSGGRAIKVNTVRKKKDLREKPKKDSKRQENT